MARAPRRPRQSPRQRQARTPQSVLAARIHLDRMYPGVDFRLVGDRWERIEEPDSPGLAEDRGWTRPEAKDWREEVRGTAPNAEAMKALRAAQERRRNGM